MTLNLTPGGKPSEVLLAEARQTGITIFGAGSFARDLAVAARSKGIAVVAMVVSQPTVDACDSVPVRSLSTLEDRLRRLPMWLGVHNRESHSDLGILQARCRPAGIGETVLPQHYYEIVADSMGWRFWLGDRRTYAPHAAAIKLAYASLDDESSRQLFASTLAFRLGQAGAAAPTPDSEPQYFTAAITAALPGPVHLVDGGAYDGETLREASRHVSLAGAYAFEPDPSNFAQLTQRLGALEIPVVCFPCGLSDATRMVGASLGRGEGSFIGGAGGGTVQVLRLDDCLSHVPVDLIKLDVEGHELAALAGATATLRRRRPALAIAGYHRHDDLWRIPLLIRELDLGYRIGYRIHMHNTFDSVFYATATP